jgi:apolipoprotein N-acyltransferase
MTEPAAGSGRVRRPALAATAGLLVALSLPPWGFWPLAFLGVMVFEIALGAAATRRERGWAGFVFAAVWMTMGLGWMWFLTVPGYLIAIVLYGSFHAAAAMLAPTGPWRTIGRPAAHTLVEIVRMSFPFGGVPLATLGISQAGGPLLGLARFGGVILITWVVFQVGFALAGPAPSLPGVQLGKRSAAAGQPHAVVALGAIVLIIVVAAFVPEGADRDDGPLTIAAVQGGGEQGTSALDVPSSQVTRVHLDATRTIEPDDDLDLVVWPENGIDVNRRPFLGSDQYQLVLAEAARLGVPFSVGVTVDSEYSMYPVDDSFVNAQVVVAPDGEITSGYEKVRIVPFGEYVPLRGPLEALGAPLDRIASDATPGRDPAIIELPDGTRLGVMISWEVFFGNRGAAGADSAILLNPTNGASYTGTILQTQQVASSLLRAVETGRWVVQVSPTGFSAFVSPEGEVFQRTDVSEQRVITMDVPRREGTTWYTALGDWPWTVAVLVVLGTALWFAEWRERRRGTGTGSDQPTGRSTSR